MRSTIPTQRASLMKKFEWIGCLFVFRLDINLIWDPPLGDGGSWDLLGLLNVSLCEVETLITRTLKHLEPLKCSKIQNCIEPTRAHDIKYSSSWKSNDVWFMKVKFSSWSKLFTWAGVPGDDNVERPLNQWVACIYFSLSRITWSSIHVENPPTHFGMTNKRMNLADDKIGHFYFSILHLGHSCNKPTKETWGNHFSIKCFSLHFPGPFYNTGSLLPILVCWTSLQLIQSFHGWDWRVHQPITNCSQMLWWVLNNTTYLKAKRQLAPFEWNIRGWVLPCPY